MSEIADFYRDKNVFITGATGFMGKVLISKLLRCCPGVGQIFILIRPKKGQEPSTRIRTLLEARIFADIPDETKKKIVLVAGDLTESGFNLSAEDRDSIIKSVSVFFHCAATVKFDEDLTLSVSMNVKGTLSALELASKMIRLEAFVHVSTAYCNPHLRTLEEKVYDDDMPYSPQEIIELVKRKGDDLNTRVETEKIIQGWPNTYTFTKAIAEKAVLQFSNTLPTVIMRPSIVIASWKDPFPGWIDNLNGPTGVMVGAGTGLLQTMLIDRRCKADIIPVDICINLLTSIPFFLVKYGSINNNALEEKDGSSLIPVYNCTSGVCNPITWGEIESFGFDCAVTYAFEKRFWYPSGSFKRHKIQDRICQIFFHHGVSLLADGIRFLVGKKPLFRPLVQKMTAAFPSLEYFGCNEWVFLNGRLEKASKSLCPRDREIFFFDPKEISWKHFFVDYFLGVRKFILKEDPSTIPKSRHALKYYRIANEITRILLFFLAYLFLSFTFTLLYNLVF